MLDFELTDFGFDDGKPIISNANVYEPKERLLTTQRCYSKQLIGTIVSTKYYLNLGFMKEHNLQLTAIVILALISLLASCSDQGSIAKTPGVTASFTQANPTSAYGEPETRTGR
jgi:hypothetical protein